MNRVTSFAATAAMTAVGFAGAIAATRLSAPPVPPKPPAALTAQQIVDRSAAVAQQMRADAPFAALLKASKGVLIMPVLDKGAFARNSQAVDGVLLTRDSAGRWTQPAFLKIDSVSLDAKGSGGAGPAAMLLMSDKAVADFTRANNFALNGPEALKVIAYTGANPPAGQGDVIVWADQSGAFAGVNVGGAQISQDVSADATFYGKPVVASQILGGSTSNPASKPLTEALSS